MHQAAVLVRAMRQEQLPGGCVYHTPEDRGYRSPAAGIVLAHYQRAHSHASGLMALGVQGCKEVEVPGVITQNLNRGLDQPWCELVPRPFAMIRYLAQGCVNHL